MIGNFNYESTVFFIRRVHQECARARIWGKSQPITLVIDNARYQRCRLVMETAKHLGIELLFLPPSSPNLNLIERLCKFVKKECLYTKYYENFGLFKQAIVECLSQTTACHKTALDSLLTLTFQIFKPATSDLR